MPLMSGRLLSSFASMKQRDFRYLTLSTASLGFGQWFQMIGLGWLVLQITGSPAQMGVINFLSGIALLLSSLPAGVLSDRFSRRDVIVWTTAAGVVQAAALAAVVVAGVAETWHLYAFAIVGGFIQGVTQPARQAFVYDITSRELLTNALTVNSLAQNVSRVTGPPLAGMIIGWWGSASAFVVLAVFKAVAMGFTLLIRPRPGAGAAAPQRKTSAVGSAMDGLRYAFGNRLILSLLLSTLIAPVLVIPYVQFLPVFAKEVLHGGPETYGLLASGVGWGSLIGLMGLAYLGDVKRKGLLFVGMQMGYAGMVLAFSRSDTIAVSMLCLAATGFVFSIMQVMANTLFQLASSNEMRGRVMSLYSMGNGFQPAGSLPMGFAIERFGVANTFSGFMLAALTAMAAVTVLFPELRRAETSPEPEFGAGKAAGASTQPRSSAR